MLLTARSASAFDSDPQPVHPADAGTTGAPDDTVPGPRPDRTILLVEDDPVVRHVVKLLLEMEGDVVLEAKDGDEALAVLAGHAGALDLLLTDVMMPGLSGAEVCDRVRARRPGLPTLFISGFYPEAVFPDQRLPAGSAFLAKPFMPEDLVEAVDLLLAKATGQPLRARASRFRRS
jgi:two-component system, cell cycle sensor histidine kinase and response regulator CckA